MNTNAQNRPLINNQFARLELAPWLKSALGFALTLALVLGISLVQISGVGGMKTAHGATVPDFSAQCKAIGDVTEIEDAHKRDEATAKAYKCMDDYIAAMKIDRSQMSVENGLDSGNKLRDFMTDTRVNIAEVQDFRKKFPMKLLLEKSPSANPDVDPEKVLTSAIAEVGNLYNDETEPAEKAALLYKYDQLNAALPAIKKIKNKQIAELTYNEIDRIENTFGKAVAQKFRYAKQLVDAKVQADVNLPGNIALDDSGYPLVSSVQWLNEGGYSGTIKMEIADQNSLNGNIENIKSVPQVGSEKALNTFQSVDAAMLKANGLSNGKLFRVGVNVTSGKDTTEADMTTWMRFDDSSTISVGFMTNGTIFTSPKAHVTSVGTFDQVKKQYSATSKDILKLIGTIIGATVASIVAAVVTALTFGQISPAAIGVSATLWIGVTGLAVGVAMSLTSMVFDFTCNDKTIEDIDLKAQSRANHSFLAAATAQKPSAPLQYAPSGYGSGEYGAFEISDFSYVNTGYYTAKPMVNWIHCANGQSCQTHSEEAKDDNGNTFGFERLGHGALSINPGKTGVQDGDEVWLTSKVASGYDRWTDGGPADCRRAGPDQTACVTREHFYYNPKAQDMAGYMTQGQSYTGDRKMHLIAFGTGDQVGNVMNHYLKQAKSEFKWVFINIGINIGTSIFAEYVGAYLKALKEVKKAAEIIRTLDAEARAAGIGESVYSEALRTMVLQSLTKQAGDAVGEALEAASERLNSLMQALANMLDRDNAKAILNWYKQNGGVSKLLEDLRYSYRNTYDAMVQSLPGIDADTTGFPRPERATLVELLSLFNTQGSGVAARLGVIFHNLARRGVTLGGDSAASSEALNDIIGLLRQLEMSHGNGARIAAHIRLGIAAGRAGVENPFEILWIDIWNQIVGFGNVIVEGSLISTEQQFLDAVNNFVRQIIRAFPEEHLTELDVIKMLFAAENYTKPEIVPILKALFGDADAINKPEVLAYLAKSCRLLQQLLIKEIVGEMPSVEAREILDTVVEDQYPVTKAVAWMRIGGNPVAGSVAINASAANVVIPSLIASQWAQNHSSANSNTEISSDKFNLYAKIYMAGVYQNPQDGTPFDREKLGVIRDFSIFALHEMNLFGQTGFGYYVDAQNPWNFLRDDQEAVSKACVVNKLATSNASAPEKPFTGVADALYSADFAAKCEVYGKQNPAWTHLQPWTFEFTTYRPAFSQSGKTAEEVYTAKCQMMDEFERGDDFDKPTAIECTRFAIHNQKWFEAQKWNLGAQYIRAWFNFNSKFTGHFKATSPVAELEFDPNAEKIVPDCQKIAQQYIDQANSPEGKKFNEEHGIVFDEKAQCNYRHKYLRDIVVVNEKTKEDAMYRLYEGHAQFFIDQDLNEGAGGKMVYVGYSTTDQENEALTNVKIDVKSTVGTNTMGYSTIDNFRYQYACNKGHKGKEGFHDFGDTSEDVGAMSTCAGQPTDLNAGAGGKYIYLYMTHDPRAGAPLINLGAENSTRKTATFAQNSTWKKLDADLNAGCKGKDTLYFWQRHNNGK